MAAKKRVACFYRVSTKGQLDKNDIPMQRRACQEFINKQGWVLVKEYTEKGVSGYKTSIEDRDELQRAKYDAENGVFDVLLCFMFDRLGRRTYETPILLKWFSTKGIEVWSVKEGQQEFENESDDITNFLRFWQSNNESRKTSMRVNEKHEQMAKDGVYRGGTPPFGYKLIKSGKKNKKGKELMTLAIDEEQSIIVREIFKLVKEEGYGSNRIAKYLNERNIKTATGSNWNTGSINFILRNPIYKGYPAYGKRKSHEGVFETKPRDEWTTSEFQIKEWVIIPESDFDKVQAMRSSRSPDKVKNENYERLNTTKSPLLLVGLIKCGHCGAPLTTTYSSKTYKLTDGTVKKWKKAKYRCSGKALVKTKCDGQTLYSNERIETAVLDEVDEFLTSLEKKDYNKFSKDYQKDEYEYLKKELSRKHKEIENEYQELNTLKQEIPKSIMGKSHFKPELLNELIEQKEMQIEKINEEIRDLETNVKDKASEIAKIRDFANSIGVWKKEFMESSHEKKKMMLRGIIDSITVSKESLNIEFKIDIVQFLSDAGNGSVSDIRGRAHRWQR